MIIDSIFKHNVTLGNNIGVTRFGLLTLVSIFISIYSLLPHKELLFILHKHIATHQHNHNTAPTIHIDILAAMSGISRDNELSNLYECDKSEGIPHRDYYIHQWNYWISEQPYVNDYTTIHCDTSLPTHFNVFERINGRNAQIDVNTTLHSFRNS